MEIYEETKEGLKGIWDDRILRQQAKLVILTAISQASDISVKTSDEIFEELDRILLKEEEETGTKREQGL